MPELSSARKAPELQPAAVAPRARAWFWIAVAGMLAAMGVVEAITARGESQTWDEGMHLAAGYSYLKTGDFRLNREHPPLFKLLAGLTLLPLNPSLPLEDASWADNVQVMFSDRFMYHNRVLAEAMLMRGRSVTMALSLLLGLVMAIWTRRHFGGGVALVALFLYASDANVIAHSRYITNDLMVTAFTFFTVVAWARFLGTLRRRDLAAAGVLLGLALMSKSSALLVPAILVLLYLFRWWQQAATGPAGARRLSLAHFAASFAVMAALSAAVAAALYWPATIQSLGGPALADQLDNSTALNRVLRAAGGFFDLPAHPYFLGLVYIGSLNKIGHPAYLLGRLSDHSWWYYYPVVLAVKTPTATLLLLAACAAIGLRKLGRRQRPAFAALRKDSAFRWAVLIAPLLVFAPTLLAAPVALGIRYTLPIFPFLFVLIAGVIVPRARMWLLILVAALQLFEVARIYPYYLAFFNTISGGPERGAHYLVDSNIDWGQDLKRLSAYLRSIGWERPLPISYFGTASMLYYGISFRPLPTTNEVEQREKLDTLVAISVTALHDVYLPPGSYRWLRQLKPMATIGHSIYVYDLRKPRRP